MFYSAYSVSLCCSVYCLCVQYMCTVHYHCQRVSAQLQSIDISILRYMYVACVVFTKYVK